MIINFAASCSFQDFLEVDDIGSCNLIGYDTLGREYIAVVDTYLGQTRILTAGPVEVDSERLPREYDIKFQQINFAANKIQNILQRFTRDLIQLEAVEKDKALNKLKDLSNYMRTDIV